MELDETSVDDIEILINSLSDTFITYLLPEVFLDRSELISKNIDRQLKSFLQDNHECRENKTEKFLEWVLDDRAAVQEFSKILWTLTDISDGTTYIGPGTEPTKMTEINESLNGLLQLINGRSLKLNKDDWQLVADELNENKLISQSDYKKIKEKNNSSKICLEIFRSIRRRKPDWPIVFIKAVKERCPLVFEKELHNIRLSSKKTENNAVAISELDCKDEVFGSKDNNLSNFSEFSLISTTKHDFDHNDHDYQMEHQMQKKINLNDSRNSAWKHLLEIQAVDSRYFTSESVVPPAKPIDTLDLSDSNFSDANDDDDEGQVPVTLNLRGYQSELAVNALKGRNTIICAPTGSGKTRVATHIIKEHLSQQQEPKKKVAFFARTVPLVMQQCKSLKKYLPKSLAVTSLTGDSEDSMHLHMIMPDNDVIVMTPRILENHFQRECLPHVGVFSMLVFDECHHTRKGEPYNTLMNSYLKLKNYHPKIKLPQIIGLTASISVEKAVQDQEAIQSILKICGNLDAECVSIVKENIEELKQLVPTPNEKMFKLIERENDISVDCITRVMNKMEEKLNFYAQELQRREFLSTVQKIPTDKKSQQYGQWVVKIKTMVKSLLPVNGQETNLSVRNIIIIAEYLAAYNVALEIHDLVQLKDVLDYLEHCFVKYSKSANLPSGEETFYSLFCDVKNILKKRKDDQNPNLLTLQAKLREFLIEKGEESRGIIFVSTRALTEALTSWLNRCEDENLRKLKAAVFTGTAATVDQGGMTQLEQEEIIRRFRSGEVRLLVATSVGEEGLDIPECNLVIKYNHVGNEVTTVQTRGRSRKEGGVSILLAMEKILLKEKINQEKAKMMMRAIIEVSKMKRSRIRENNKKHQELILKNELILERVKQMEEKRLLKEPFQMVCHLCRKLVISSQYIKTIFDAHRVVVDGSILKSIQVIPYKNVKYLNEVQLIGSVYCMVEPEPGKYCSNKLGSMMIFSKIPFLVLSIKNFGFDTNSKNGLEYYNQWKKVPYFLEGVEPSDFESYILKMEEAKHPESILKDSKIIENENTDSDDNDDDQPVEKKTLLQQLALKDLPLMVHSFQAQVEIFSNHSEGTFNNIHKILNDCPLSTISNTPILLESVRKPGQVLLSLDSCNESINLKASGKENLQQSYLVCSSETQSQVNSIQAGDAHVQPAQRSYNSTQEEDEQAYSIQEREAHIQPAQRSYDSSQKGDEHIPPILRSLDSTQKEGIGIQYEHRNFDDIQVEGVPIQPLQINLNETLDGVEHIQALQKSFETNKDQNFLTTAMQNMICSGENINQLNADDKANESQNEETEAKQLLESHAHQSDSNSEPSSQRSRMSMLL